MVSSGASEDDVMKYATDFKSQFGVKKKDGGIVSSPIPLKLPSEDFKQGQKFAETAFTVPTAAVEREKEKKEMKETKKTKKFLKPDLIKEIILFETNYENHAIVLKFRKMLEKIDALKKII